MKLYFYLFLEIKDFMHAHEIHLGYKQSTIVTSNRKDLLIIALEKHLQGSAICLKCEHY